MDTKVPMPHCLSCVSLGTVIGQVYVFTLDIFEIPMPRNTN